MKNNARLLTVSILTIAITGTTAAACIAWLRPNEDVSPLVQAIFVFLVSLATGIITALVSLGATNGNDKS